MTAPLTFAEFEARAGTLLGRRPFGARSGRHLAAQARLLRDSADDIEMCARLQTDMTPACHDIAAQLALALGAALYRIAAIARELGTPLETLVDPSPSRGRSRAPIPPGDTAC